MESINKFVGKKIFEISFLRHTTAFDLLIGFKSGLTNMDIDNILQVLMDG